MCALLLGVCMGNPDRQLCSSSSCSHPYGLWKQPWGTAGSPFGAESKSDHVFLLVLQSWASFQIRCFVPWFPTYLKYHALVLERSSENKGTNECNILRYHCNRGHWCISFPLCDNSISLEGHIIMYFQIKSQLRGHASLWELVQSQCQACNSKALQSRAPERRINRSEAQRVLPVSFPTELFLVGGTWLFVSVSKTPGSVLLAVPEHCCLLASMWVQPAGDALPSAPPFVGQKGTALTSLMVFSHLKWLC